MKANSRANNNLSRLFLVLHCLLCLLFGLLHVVVRILYVRLNSVDRLALQVSKHKNEYTQKRRQGEPAAYLLFHKHCHVHEHLVQFANTFLNLQDVLVSGLNIRKLLLCCLRFGDYLSVIKQIETLITMASFAAALPLLLG